MISLTSPVKTRAHAWPAGAKLAALCVTTVLLFQANGVVVQVVCFGTFLALSAAPGRLFLLAGLRQLLRLWPFVVVLICWHVLVKAPLDGAEIVFRMLTAVGLANLVTMTTQLSEMQALVLWLLAPLRRFGVRTDAIALAMALVVRFTPVLGQKGQHLVAAWRARSPRRPGWRVAMPLVVLAIDDAEHIADALKARGGIRD